MSNYFPTANGADDHSDRPMSERIFYLVVPDGTPAETLRRSQMERKRRQWAAIKTEFERLVTDFETLRDHCANPTLPGR